MPLLKSVAKLLFSRHALPLLLCLPLLWLVTVGLKLDPSKVPSPLLGKQAPSFTLLRLDDQATTVSPVDLRGEVWVLNVWASWCLSCRVEHPLLYGISDRVLLVGLNYKDETAAAVQWLEARGNPYGLVVVDHDGAAGFDWGVYGVPETFVIDRDGIIRYKHIGPLDPTVIQDNIMPLVASLQE